MLKPYPDVVETGPLPQRIAEEDASVRVMAGGRQKFTLEGVVGDMAAATCATLRSPPGQATSRHSRLPSFLCARRNWNRHVLGRRCPDRLLTGTMSDEEWLDNHPCDRYPPKFRKVFMVFTAIAFPSMIAVMFLIQGALGGFWGSSEVAAAFALLLGGGLALLWTAAILSVEARQPIEVMFDREAFQVRTRRGRLYTQPYASIVGIVPLKLMSGRPPNECQCYLVELAARIPGTTGIWLTPENKAKLDAILRTRGSAFPVRSSPGRR